MQPSPTVTPLYVNATTPSLNAKVVSWIDTHARKVALTEQWQSRFGESYPVDTMLGRDPVAARIAGHFLQQEVIEARRFAPYIAESAGWFKDGETSIPILYSPDGGTHTAHALQQGVQWFTQGRTTLHAVTKPADGVMEFALPGLPDDAAQDVLASRRVILCDSTVSFGSTINRLQRQLTKLMSEAGGPPLAVFVVANNAHGVALAAAEGQQAMDDMPRYRVNNDLSINRSLYGTAKEEAASEAKRHFSIRYLFAGIGGKTYPFDRGDALAAVDHPLASTWRDALVIRQPQSASHQTILDEARENNRGRGIPDR